MHQVCDLTKLPRHGWLKKRPLAHPFPIHLPPHLLSLARLLDGVAEEFDNALRADLPKRSPLLRGRAFPEAIQQRQRVIVIRLRLFCPAYAVQRPLYSSDRKRKLLPL